MKNPRRMIPATFPFTALPACSTTQQPDSHQNRENKFHHELRDALKPCLAYTTLLLQLHLAVVVLVVVSMPLMVRISYERAAAIEVITNSVSDAKDRVSCAPRYTRLESRRRCCKIYCFEIINMHGFTAAYTIFYAFFSTFLLLLFASCRSFFLFAYCVKDSKKKKIIKRLSRVMMLKKGAKTEEKLRRAVPSLAPADAIKQKNGAACGRDTK